MKKCTDAEEKKPILAFDYSFKVEVYEPDFEPLSSVNSLDVKKLATTDQKIEIGYMKGGCCRQLVYAVIKNGMVIGIETEKCEAPKESIPEEVKTLFSDVVKKLKLPGPWKPVPVEEFVAMVNDGRYPIRTGGGTNCIWICVWNTCFVCCNDPFDCFFMDGKKTFGLKAIA